MTSKKRNISKADIIRLKGIAFWYWEYMRRNPLYIRYCDVITEYDDYFKSLGVYDYMQSKEYLDEMSEYVTTHDESEDLKYTPFRRRLEKEHGEEAGRRFFKYGFLSCGFEDKFGRIYKHYSVGIDSTEALERLMSGRDISFKTNEVADLAALTKLNGSWLITVDDFTPDTFTYDLKRSKTIKIDPNGVLDDPGKVGLEIYALNLINKAVESLFEEQKIADETLQSVYNLNFSGKTLRNADISRLAALWLWDKAHEKGRQNPAAFKEVYPLLKAKLNDKKRTIVGNWEQQDLKANRIRTHYEMTDYCIRHRTITHLNK
jgi:hypothetical protein